SGMITTNCLTIRMTGTKKYALVTGGSRGIGRAICKKLAEDTDYNLLINYQSNEQAALDTLSEIQAAGGQGEIIQFDVSNHQQVKTALGRWENENPEALVEIIVNNAGISRDGLFMWMTEEDWDSVIQTSLRG